MVLMLAVPDSRAAVPSKAVLLGDHVTVFDVLVTARTQPVGIALTSRGDDVRTQALLRLLGIPAIVDVAMAFRWASPGDVALLDGDHGFLVVNPSRAEVATLRALRRGGAGAPPAPPSDPAHLPEHATGAPAIDEIDERDH